MRVLQLDSANDNWVVLGHDLVHVLFTGIKWRVYVLSREGKTDMKENVFWMKQTVHFTYRILIVVIVIIFIFEENKFKETRIKKK